MKRQHGFSLVEVMVTMVVLSIGLLGIAGIIVTNLKNTQSSSTRAQATLLANDIIDRMRANRRTAEVVPSPYTLAMGGDGGGVAGVPGLDLQDWTSSVAAGVPQGKASITMEDGRNFVVIIQWDDRRAQGGGAGAGIEQQQLRVETRL